MKSKKLKILQAELALFSFIMYCNAKSNSHLSREDVINQLEDILYLYKK